MQGTLTLPGIRAREEVSMIVYFYELMSDTHTPFSFPVFTTVTHVDLCEHGYLVFQPDVRTRWQARNVGPRPASPVRQEGDEIGYADPARIGLQATVGRLPIVLHRHPDQHVRGGSDGCAPTDLTTSSARLQVNRNIQQGITEVDRSAWAAGDAMVGARVCMRAVAVHKRRRSRRRHDLHGTADARLMEPGPRVLRRARRLGKKVILLSYPDEAHHLGRRENQKISNPDAAVFDTISKAHAPVWMTEGCRSGARVWTDHHRAAAAKDDQVAGRGVLR